MSAAINMQIRKSLLITALTAFSCTARAQSFISLEGIDVIKIQEGKGPLSFYQKKDNKYREIVVDFNFDPEKKKISYKISEDGKLYQNIFKPNDRVIAVNDLKSYGPGALFRMLSKYQFKATEKGNGYATSYYVRLFNPTNCSFL